MASLVEKMIEDIIAEDATIDEQNIHTEKLPRYAQEILSEFIRKYYNFEVTVYNFGDVFSEFSKKIRPHLESPYLPTQKRENKGQQ